MKKFVLLILLLQVNLIAFSRVGIKNYIDTVRLPEKVGRVVARDLIAYDSLLIEHQIQKDNLQLYLQNIMYKDKIIQNKDSIIDIQSQILKSKDTIITLKDAQIDNYVKITNDLQHNVKVANRKNTSKTILLFSVVALSVAAFILK